MPPAAFAAIGFTGAVAGGVAGSAAAAFTTAVVAAAVKGALVGMVIGAASAALTGGDVGKGALFGAIGGAVVGGLTAGFSAGAGASVIGPGPTMIDPSPGIAGEMGSGAMAQTGVPAAGVSAAAQSPAAVQPSAGVQPPAVSPTVKPASFWNTEGGAGLLKGLGGGIKDVGLSMMKPDEEELSEIKLKEEAARREANQPGAWVKRTADINLPETWKNLVANIYKYKAPLQTQKPGLLSQGVTA